MNNVATKEDARNGLYKILEWVGEHDWEYEDCPNLFDGLAVLKSYVLDKPMDNAKAECESKVDLGFGLCIVYDNVEPRNIKELLENCPNTKAKVVDRVFDDSDFDYEDIDTMTFDEFYNLLGDGDYYVAEMVADCIGEILGESNIDWDDWCIGRFFIMVDPKKSKHTKDELTTALTEVARILYGVPIEYQGFKADIGNQSYDFNEEY